MIYKVYIVTSKLNNSFYIGCTNKTGTALDNYFGSNKGSGSWEDKTKDICRAPELCRYLFETERKSEARYLELFLQMVYRSDDRCVNDMLNIRTNFRWTKGLTDDDIFKIRENTSRLLEMRLERRSDDVSEWTDNLLRLQLYLSEPEGEA